eukprot:TRINITY_DN19316_c0_g1_i3.p1 TRINITY_DN19316_c0_g1~~TRINITY_DN19316_c0_g1_i3.p1  ORF type:complete len:548 (+),score=119.88 TRINITY_DN19316_c0_g1_i3:150-1793(+)
MTIYYDAQKPTLLALVPSGSNFLVKVATKPEFWFYMGMHGAMIYAHMNDIVNWPLLDWSTNGSLMYFVTFYVIYYNSHCYSRYEDLYELCTQVLSGITQFVLELVSTFKQKELYHHRLQAMKYLLAATYLFFMGISEDTITERAWGEIVKKGLLTKRESMSLMRYPGPDLVPVLMTWVMFIVDDALARDVMNAEKMQNTSMIHNRFHVAVRQVTKSMRRIASIIAMPIPYAYWHFMNFVIFFNVVLLSVLLAPWSDYITFLPYTIIVLVIVGFRDMCNMLADPFGQGPADFPLVKWLDYTFDHSVSMMEAYNNEVAYKWIPGAIRSVKLFTEDELRKEITNKDLFKRNYQAATDGIYNWEDSKMPFDQLKSREDTAYLDHHLKERLKDTFYSLKPARSASKMAAARELEREEQMQQIEQDILARRRGLRDAQEMAVEEMERQISEPEAPPNLTATSPQTTPRFFKKQLGDMASPGSFKWSDERNQWKPSQQGGFTSFDAARERIREALQAGARSVTDNQFDVGGTSYGLTDVYENDDLIAGMQEQRD